jgi:hypothetical protein
MRHTAHTLALCLLASGCAQVAEANIRSAETLIRGDSSDTARDVSIAVLATTGVAGLVLLGFLIDGASPDGATEQVPAPPVDPGIVEHGWGLVRSGGRATWQACHAPHHCGYERRTIDEADLVDAEPVGITYPVRADTTSGPEVGVLALRLRRPSTTAAPR